MELFKTSVYSFQSKHSIMSEKHLGICTDITSIRTPEYSVCCAESFQGCPYSDTGFQFDIRIDGEKIRAEKWEWLPNAMTRHGSAPEFDVESLLCVIPGMRTFVMKVTIKDTLGKTRRVPLQVAYRGCPHYTEKWFFGIPAAEKGCLENYSADENILSCNTSDASFHFTSSLKNMHFFKTAYLWENEVEIPGNGSTTFYVSCSMGAKEKSLAEAKYSKGKYEGLIKRSFDWFLKEADRIHRNLPRLSSSDPELDALYYRSLVTYMLCRWENPDLFMSPYFSTGSINGSCMCSYLWDYCGGLMLHPLYDTDGNKKVLLGYLRNDLTISFALMPIEGGKWGPWYQINQEKIICMVYYHVLHTGEK